MQTIVDKVSKKRITPLKKAILKKRELEKQHRLLRKEERRRLKEALKSQQVTVEEAGTETEGYETIDEGETAE